ncbi:MAG: sulfite exporter TauE/SafE family protein [bacterium]|nr:sulfite exporter TauE/SafE family protein [bacterium]
MQQNQISMPLEPANRRVFPGRQVGRGLLTSSLLLALSPSFALAADASERSALLPWWGWAMALFLTTFVIGVFGVMAGIGGGVLFVPLVGSFFPFHIDFVRGAGLFIALSSSLAAAPSLLKANLASIKLALPVALVASGFSIIGAFLGLWLSALNPAYIQGSLGVLILMIVVIMILSKKSEHPEVRLTDGLAQLLGIGGTYTEGTTGEEIKWTVHNTIKAMVLFAFVGTLAGMFGLGAGWANVPVLNLVMGAPVKVAVATSGFALSITDTTAAWIYLNKGAVLPIVTVPSMAGIMIGARIGAKLLPKVKPSLIRQMVIGVLLLAGIRSLLKAFGI